MACSIIKSGIRILNPGLLILCLKTFIPITAPRAPNMMANKLSVDSLILLLPFTAYNLSIPKAKNVMTFITQTKKINGKYNTLKLSILLNQTPIPLIASVASQ